MQADGSGIDVTLARVAALFSIGCGVIHGVVTQPHFEEYTPFGWFFLAVTLFQLGWGVWILIRPDSGWLVVGAVVNLAVAAVWLWTRTVGVPLGPHAGDVEAAGVRDVFSTVFEVVMVAVLGLVLLRRGRTIVPARRAAVVLAVAAVTVAAATAVAVASPDAEHAETEQHETEQHGTDDEHGDEEGTHVEGQEPGDDEGAG